MHMYNVTNLTHMYTVASACVSIYILKIRLFEKQMNGLRESCVLEGQRVISSQFWCLKLISGH